MQADGLSTRNDKKQIKDLLNVGTCIDGTNGQGGEMGGDFPMQPVKKLPPMHTVGHFWTTHVEKNTKFPKHLPSTKKKVRDYTTLSLEKNVFTLRNKSNCSVFFTKYVYFQCTVLNIIKASLCWFFCRFQKDAQQKIASPPSLYHNFWITPHAEPPKIPPCTAKKLPPHHQSLVAPMCDR